MAYFYLGRKRCRTFQNYGPNHREEKYDTTYRTSEKYALLWGTNSMKSAGFSSKNANLWGLACVSDEPLYHDSTGSRQAIGPCSRLCREQVTGDKWQVPGFAVETPPAGGNLSVVSSTLSLKRKNQRLPKNAPKAFWVRPANPELDRAGDWLLKNLTTTRARCASRAGPA